MATQSVKLAREEAAPAARGFPELPCPLCGQADSGVQVELTDLTGETAFHCPACEADFGPDDVRQMISKWTAVLRWIDLAPEMPAE
jgi:hypothetical protein